MVAAKEHTLPTTSPCHQQEDVLQQSPQHSQPQQQELEYKNIDPTMDTSSYVVVEKKIEEIIKEFDPSVGTGLVEIVRTK